MSLGRESKHEDTIEHTIELVDKMIRDVAESVNKELEASAASYVEAEEVLFSNIKTFIVELKRLVRQDLFPSELKPKFELYEGVPPPGFASKPNFALTAETLGSLCLLRNFLIGEYKQINSVYQRTYQEYESKRRTLKPHEKALLGESKQVEKDVYISYLVVPEYKDVGSALKDNMKLLNQIKAWANDILENKNIHEKSLAGKMTAFKKQKELIEKDYEIKEEKRLQTASENADPKDILDVIFNYETVRSDVRYSFKEREERLAKEKGLTKAEEEKEGLTQEEQKEGLTKEEKESLIKEGRGDTKEEKALIKKQLMRMKDHKAELEKWDTQFKVWFTEDRKKVQTLLSAYCKEFELYRKVIPVFFAKNENAIQAEKLLDKYTVSRIVENFLKVYSTPEAAVKLNQQLSSLRKWIAINEDKPTEKELIDIKIFLDKAKIQFEAASKLPKAPLRPLSTSTLGLYAPPAEKKVDPFVNVAQLVYDFFKSNEKEFKRPFQSSRTYDGVMKILEDEKASPPALKKSVNKNVLLEVLDFLKINKINQSGYSQKFHDGAGQFTLQKLADEKSRHQIVGLIVYALAELQNVDTTNEQMIENFNKKMAAGLRKISGAGLKWSTEPVKTYNKLSRGV